MLSARVMNETKKDNLSDLGGNEPNQNKKLQEVAKIKFEHYQVRRFRKLAVLQQTAEKIAFEKRIERE